MTPWTQTTRHGHYTATGRDIPTDLTDWTSQ
jgi:hypothetical protein